MDAKSLLMLAVVVAIVVAVGTYVHRRVGG